MRGLSPAQVTYGLRSQENALKFETKTIKPGEWTSIGQKDSDLYNVRIVGKKDVYGQQVAGNVYFNQSSITAKEKQLYVIKAANGNVSVNKIDNKFENSSKAEICGAQ